MKVRDHISQNVWLYLIAISIINTVKHPVYKILLFTMIQCTSPFLGMKWSRWRDLYNRYFVDKTIVAAVKEVYFGGVWSIFFNMSMFIVFSNEILRFKRFYVHVFVKINYATNVKYIPLMPKLNRMPSPQIPHLMKR